jgi:hypothetical protein
VKTDLAGAAALLRLDGRLNMMSAPPRVLTVLQLTNLDRVLRVHPSVEPATVGW